MSKHLEQLDLERWHSRELSPDEMTAVILHLSQCPKCMEVYRKMFPEVMNTERLVGVLPADDAIDEPFHLDYEEHLRPFVDNEIADVDREIVETHIITCGHCASMLRDLQEFRELLDADTGPINVEKIGFFEKVVAVFRSNLQSFAFAAIVLMVLFGGLVWYVFIEHDTNSIDLAVRPAEPTSETAVVAPDEKVVDSPVPYGTSPPTEPTEIAKLNLPSFLKDLKVKAPGELRGGETAKPISIGSPNGVALRGTPLLRWRAIPDIETYDVSIFDDRDERVAGEDGVRGSTWNSPKLNKGQIYQWQVSGTDANGRKHIGHGRFYLISKAEEARIDRAPDALERARALAEAGLVSQAITELQKYQRTHPESNTVKSYLRQIKPNR